MTPSSSTPAVPAITSTVAAVCTSGHVRPSRLGIGLALDLPVLAELWFGVENSSSRERNADKLRRVLPELIIGPLTEAAAEEYGRIAAELKRIGRPIGKIDMLIAAIALSLGKTTVVSADSDLTAVPGLTVENWATT